MILLTAFTSSAKWRARPCPSSVSSLYRQSYAVSNTSLENVLCKLLRAQDTFVSIRRWLPLLKVAQQISIVPKLSFWHFSLWFPNQTNFCQKIYKNIIYFNKNISLGNSMGTRKAVVLQGCVWLLRMTRH